MPHLSGFRTATVIPIFAFAQHLLQIALNFPKQFIAISEFLFYLFQLLRRESGSPLSSFESKAASRIFSAAMRRPCHVHSRRSKRRCGQVLSAFKAKPKAALDVCFDLCNIFIQYFVTHVLQQLDSLANLASELAALSVQSSASKLHLCLCPFESC